MSDTAALAAILQKLDNVQTDIQALRSEQAAIRDEYRQQVIQLRSDLAVGISRQNSAIEDNKKKLSGSRPQPKS